MVAVTTGCSNKKPESVDTPSVDSVAVDTADTVDSTTAIIAETPMPKAADQLFDDFSSISLLIRNYSAPALNSHCL